MAHFFSRPRSQRRFRLVLRNAEPKVEDEHKAETKPRAEGKRLHLRGDNCPAGHGTGYRHNSPLGALVTSTTKGGCCAF